MPRKEGPFAHGEKLSPAAEHRADGNESYVDSGLSILERQFGPDVVVDDPARAEELRQADLRKRLAATVNYEITPDTLRSARQEELQGVYPEQAVPFSPLSNMVDMPDNTPPVQPPTQSMYELSGGPQ